MPVFFLIEAITYLLPTVTAQIDITFQYECSYEYIYTLRFYLSQNTR